MINKVFVPANVDSRAIQATLDRLVFEINAALTEVREGGFDPYDLEQRLDQLEQKLRKPREEAVVPPPELPEVGDPANVELVKVEADGVNATVTLRYRPPSPLGDFTGVSVYGRWVTEQPIWLVGGGEYAPVAEGGVVVSYVKLQISQGNEDRTIRLYVTGRSRYTENPVSPSTPFVTAQIPAGNLAPPVPPTSVTTTVLTPNVETWGVSTTWTMPSSIGGTVSVEVYMRYFSDPAGSVPLSDPILLGGADVADGTLRAGFWPRPSTNTWARVSVRSLNRVRVASVFVHSGVFQVPVASGIPGIPPPNGPVSVTVTPIIRDNDTYGLLSSWVPPNPVGGTIEYQVQARFWRDSGLTQPDSDWIDLGVSWPPETQMESGYWPLPDYEVWVQVRIRAVNGIGDATSWVLSAAAYIAPPAPPDMPTYVAGTLIPYDEGGYKVRIGWSPMPRAASYHLYLRFYADQNLTQPDGGPILVGTSTRQQPVPPYISPVEEFGPYPRNVAPRWMVAGVSAVSANGRASSIRWSPLAELVEPRIPPAPPTNVSIALNEKTDSGVETFGYTITTGLPSNSADIAKIEVEARFWRDSALTQPDSDWILLGYAPVASPSIMVTDRWPKAGYQTWTRVRARTLNRHDIPSGWVESNTVVVPAGSVDLSYAKLSTVGEGLQVTAGKLKAKLDTARLTTDGAGNITTASNRDLPVIAGSQPATVWLGSTIVYWAGQIWTWSGNRYVPDANAQWVKQQLQSNGLTAAEFATSYGPVRLLAYTPSTYEGEFVVDTSQRRLLRWNGSAYARAMSGADIKAELIVDKLTASEISSGAINTAHLAGNQIFVGPVAGQPPRLVVTDSFGVAVGAIGEWSGFAGLWAASGRFGGSFSNPIIQLTGAGATITNASINVNSGDSAIHISPATGFRINHPGSSGIYTQLRPLGLDIVGIGQCSVTEGGIFTAGVTGSAWLRSNSPEAGIQSVGGEASFKVGWQGPFVQSTDGYRVGNTTVIDRNANGWFSQLYIGSSNIPVIDHNHFGRFQQLYIGLSSLPVIDGNQYGYFNRLTVGGYLWLDEVGKMRQPFVYSEPIYLGGITSQKWLPAYDQSGYFIGKIPLI